jgi:hypothetical protein
MDTVEAMVAGVIAIITIIVDFIGDLLSITTIRSQS